MLKDYWQLTKPGVTFMVIISAFSGFYLGSGADINLWLLFHTLTGSWLVAAGTNALNQLIERDLDAKMKRTQKRPLPDGRLSVSEVAIFSITISLAGIIYLTVAANLLTGALAAATLLTYVFIYTPMKQRSHIATLIGAVPGALPAMGGWTAAQGEISAEAWILFTILFFWQLPHFLAIAWLYKDDYTRGGFPVLPAIDKQGVLTSWYVISNCMALIFVSLLPTMVGIAGKIYFIGAFFMGIYFLYSGIQLMRQRSNNAAKKLLRTSIVYLPVVLALMLMDKMP